MKKLRDVIGGSLQKAGRRISEGQKPQPTLAQLVQAERASLQAQIDAARARVERANAQRPPEPPTTVNDQAELAHQQARVDVLGVDEGGPLTRAYEGRIEQHPVWRDASYGGSYKTTEPRFEGPGGASRVYGDNDRAKQALTALELRDYQGPVVIRGLDSREEGAAIGELRATSVEVPPQEFKGELVAADHTWIDRGSRYGVRKVYLEVSGTRFELKGETPAIEAKLAAVGKELGNKGPALLRAYAAKAEGRPALYVSSIDLV